MNFSSKTNFSKNMKLYFINKDSKLDGFYDQHSNRVFIKKNIKPTFIRNFVVMHEIAHNKRREQTLKTEIYWNSRPFHLKVKGFLNYLKEEMFAWVIGLYFLVRYYPESEGLFRNAKTNFQNLTSEEYFKKYEEPFLKKRMKEMNVPY